ncbi:class I SAM-dependent methyltransferase [Curtobacterium citri]|uniref:class I SAM-dependent methyltransferase n=1 Tax=Curtobacterium citri TaxID=3055139 RepID=UPI003DA78494
MLDVGCGTGVLSASLAATSPRVLGMDPSAKSIAIARRESTALSNLEFECATVEDWSALHAGECFPVAVLNMVLMDVPDLSKAMKALANVRAVRQVVATFTHPAFWPRYWGYDKLPEFDYSREFAVVSQFRTAAKDYGHLTTHYHRPLENYLSAARRVGFAIANVAELRGTEDSRDFPYPRFIGLELRR